MEAGYGSRIVALAAGCADPGHSFAVAFLRALIA